MYLFSLAQRNSTSVLRYLMLRVHDGESDIVRKDHRFSRAPKIACSSANANAAGHHRSLFPTLSLKTNHQHNCCWPREAVDVCVLTSVFGIAFRLPGSAHTVRIEGPAVLISHSEDLASSAGISSLPARPNTWSTSSIRAHLSASTRLVK